MTSERTTTQAAELPLLNGVPTTVLDVEVNEATTAARRFTTINPYPDVRVLDSPVTGGTMDEFLAGPDNVVGQRDSLDLPPASMRSSGCALKNTASTVF